MANSTKATVTKRHYIDLTGFNRLRDEVDQLRLQYATAQPFPHIVLDGVLPIELFDEATAEFPDVDDPSWTGYLHVNEMKYGNPRVRTWGLKLQQIADTLCGDEFVELLQALTGFDDLLADAAMDGGGLHQTLRGGFLNVHTDFTTNHRERSWRRRVNVLFYLNERWSPEWGGALELWDAEVTSCVASIEPVGNRMVIFTTADDAYHGHPEPLRCPEGTARRSLALYYFTREQLPRRKSTNYRPRPGDGWKRIAIWADRWVLSAYDSAKIATRPLRSIRQRGAPTNKSRLPTAPEAPMNNRRPPGAPRLRDCAVIFACHPHPRPHHVVQQ